MRQTYEVMGTVVTLDIPEATDEKPFNAAFERLDDIDDKYSPFQAASEVSLYNDGKLNRPDPEFKQVMSQCKRWQKITDGYFSAWYKNSYEPSGYVKGWAIAEAAEAIRSVGYKTFCLGVGGGYIGR